MSIQRREVYLVMKQLPDGQIIYVEGMNSARNYFFDGHVRYDIGPGGSASIVQLSPTDRPMQLFHVPNDNYGKWQAAYCDFGCSPAFGEVELEYIIFVGAYSNDRNRTFELMREGLERAWDIVEGKRQLRDGEYND